MSYDLCEFAEQLKTQLSSAYQITLFGRTDDQFTTMDSAFFSS